jgi:uncharacterized membrane protein YkoI
MDKDTKRLTKVLGAIGIAAGLGLGAAGIAAAATDTSSPASSAPAVAQESRTGQDQQDPELNGSVQVPEQQHEVNDATEAQALQAAAKITPEQAKQAALAALPGTVGRVELDNENGSVVYSVEVTATGTTTDVKVDAGNGKVLAQESSETDGTKETGSEHAGNETDDTETPPASGATG